MRGNTAENLVQIYDIASQVPGDKVPSLLEFRTLYLPPGVKASNSADESGLCDLVGNYFCFASAVNASLVESYIRGLEFGLQLSQDYLDMANANLNYLK